MKTFPEESVAMPRAPEKELTPANGCCRVFQVSDQDWPGLFRITVHWFALVWISNVLPVYPATHKFPLASTATWRAALVYPSDASRTVCQLPGAPPAALFRTTQP